MTPRRSSGHGVRVTSPLRSMRVTVGEPDRDWRRGTRQVRHAPRPALGLRQPHEDLVLGKVEAVGAQVGVQPLDVSDHRGTRHTRCCGSVSQRTSFDDMPRSYLTIQSSRSPDRPKRRRQVGPARGGFQDDHRAGAAERPPTVGADKPQARGRDARRRGAPLPGRERELRQSLTWAQTKDDIWDIAAGLLALGLQLEERVAIASNTRLEWVLLDLAVNRAGGATTAVYPEHPGPEFAHIARIRSRTTSWPRTSSSSRNCATPRSTRPRSARRFCSTAPTRTPLAR